MPEPLSHLSRRSVAKPPLQRGPDYPDVVSVREIGGPEDPADRRLVLDVATLEELLARAKASPTRRVVVHGIGLRVQLLDDGAHRWEHVTLLGRAPEPEQIPFIGFGGSL